MQEIENRLAFGEVTDKRPVVSWLFWFAVFQTGACITNWRPECGSELDHGDARCGRDKRPATATTAAAAGDEDDVFDGGTSRPSICTPTGTY